jgi:hypothetical protein
MKRIVLGLTGVVLLGLSWPAQTEELPSPGWLRDAPRPKVQRPQYDAPGNSLALGELGYAQGNQHFAKVT